MKYQQASKLWKKILKASSSKASYRITWIYDRYFPLSSYFMNRIAAESKPMINLSLHVVVGPIFEWYNHCSSKTFSNKSPLLCHWYFNILGVLNSFLLTIFSCSSPQVFLKFFPPRLCISGGGEDLMKISLIPSIIHRNTTSLKHLKNINNESHFDKDKCLL